MQKLGPQETDVTQTPILQPTQTIVYGGVIRSIVHLTPTLRFA